MAISIDEVLSSLSYSREEVISRMAEIFAPVREEARRLGNPDAFFDMSFPRNAFAVGAVDGKNRARENLEYVKSEGMISLLQNAYSDAYYFGNELGQKLIPLQYPNRTSNELYGITKVMLITEAGDYVLEYNKRPEVRYAAKDIPKSEALQIINDPRQMELELSRRGVPSGLIKKKKY